MGVVYQDVSYRAVMRECEELRAENARLRAALKEIERWNNRGSLSEPRLIARRALGEQFKPPTQMQPPPKVGLLQEVFNLDEGPVTLIVPATLSEESYADLADQLELFLRRAKRRTVPDPVQSAPFFECPDCGKDIAEPDAPHDPTCKRSLQVGADPKQARDGT